MDLAFVVFDGADTALAIVPFVAVMLAAGLITVGSLELLLLFELLFEREAVLLPDGCDNDDDPITDDDDFSC
jgi:secreted protein with Ig-like and vWFA domain